ncbi:autotransporter secretion outer membrane protein TamA [Pseudomonas duriflava]|uniref:Translocation and assembly module subunit TamA n=2 Tax=Pseudomonas duriflava TaxID=459528 RepID=A0A562Q7M2_9PSED|nr:autotransporter secretion outer membrane protein TamA [Pseudomonas duriflava]
MAEPTQLVVQVSPGNKALQDNISNYIGSLGERDVRGLHRLRRTAIGQAEEAAHALGYYQAQFDSRVEPGPPPRLILDVKPGEPVRLRNVEIRIEGEASQLKVFQRPSADVLKPGAQLNHGNYEDAKTLIQNQAARYGFFSGHFTQQRLLIDPEGGTADIQLVYDSGPRYRLGKVEFSGNAPFDPDLLERMVPFEAGTPYDSEALAELQQNLLKSDFFEGVRVNAAPADAQNHVIPINVDLTTRKPRTLGLGPGYSTDVGPRLRATWDRHWLNPQGHSLGAEVELSAPRQNVGLWYDIPGQDPINDKFRLAGGYQYEEIADDDTLSKLLTVGPEWHRKLPSGWERVFSIKWQREEYRLGDDEGLSTLLMPGVQYSYLRSDNRIDPSRGYRLQFGLSAAKEGILSDANMVHATALVRGLTTFGEGHRLLGRLQVGGNATNGYKKIPPSLRFFAGGDQSVRGYDYQTLSPENSDGDKIGGRYMIAGSVEYQYPLKDKWRLATFVDQGGAFNSLTTPDIKTSVGLGVRWVSPVGPIRVDLAHGLDEEGGIRLHFSMGSEL